MKLWKKFLLGFFIVFVLMQFIRPKRNVSAQTSSNDITLLFAVPKPVKNILNKACNDCHSNNTRYPWYAEIQPVAWWLNRHVEEGKQELNFSEFASYSPRKQYRRMQQTVELIEEGEMPLPSYTLIHTDAKLTNEEKQIIATWTNTIIDTLKARYPADSLVRKK